MKGVEPSDLGAGGIARAIHDREIAPERPEKPPPGIGAEIGVVGDTRRHRRVCDLQQEGARSRPEQEHGLAIEPPRLRFGAVKPRVRRQRAVHCRTIADEAEDMLSMTEDQSWGRDFDPDELARYETRVWKAYYRHQPARIFGYLVQALHAQVGVSWPRAIAASLLLTRAGAGFSRATGDYERFAPDIVRAYRILGLPADVDAEEVARRELRWWVIRREMGLASGEAAGEVITDLYAALYGVPRERLAEAGRLRGMAAEVRDHGAAADPDGSTGAGRDYWPQVAKLLRDSYRSLRVGLDTGTTEYE
jgi:hypothetical protein